MIHGWGSKTRAVRLARRAGRNSGSIPLLAARPVRLVVRTLPCITEKNEASQHAYSSSARLVTVATRVLGKDETLDRNQRRAPCSISPTGRGGWLRTSAIRVRILDGAPIRLTSPTAEAACSKQVTVRVQLLRQAPCSVRQMGRHRFYTPTRPGSIPGRSTIHASLAHWKSACSTRKRRQDQNLQDAPSSFLSSKAEQSADNR